MTQEQRRAEMSRQTITIELGLYKKELKTAIVQELVRMSLNLTVEYIPENPEENISVGHLVLVETGSLTAPWLIRFREQADESKYVDFALPDITENPIEAMPKLLERVHMYLPF